MSTDLLPALPPTQRVPGLFPEGPEAGEWSWPHTSNQQRAKEWQDTSSTPHTASRSEEGQFYLYNRWRGHAAYMLLPEHIWNVVKVKVQAEVTLPRACHDGIRASGVTDPFILNFGILCAEWSASRAGRFNLGEKDAGTHRIGAAMDTSEEW